eukprot:5535667-Ditylum_brightwellii.AAC.1
MEHYQRKICHLNQKINPNWMTQNLPMKMNITNTNTSLGLDNGQWYQGDWTSLMRFHHLVDFLQCPELDT